jgi:NADP-dependent aldehyde dehydrogenase
MTLEGSNFIGTERSAQGARTYRAVNPATGGPLPTAFHEATPAEIDRALALADEAFPACRRVPPGGIAAFLERIAEELLASGEALVDEAVAETGLPRERLAGERGRTVHQLRMFAALVREGSWVDARIDRGDPARRPVPKPDIRRMLVPLGPVAVFGASNFPLAYSVAGGDTASALAAGNPVIVKAHPAHPGTSERAALAVRRAADAVAMPPGVFSMVHGPSPDTGARLATDPRVKAVAFTGSLAGGRALFDAAARRPDPIPVFAEMGSINPLVLLPGALRERAEAIAEGFHQSMTLGCGQYCTKPGFVAGIEGPDLRCFAGRAAALVAGHAPATLLHAGILRAFEAGVAAVARIPGVRPIARAGSPADPGRTQAVPSLFETDAATFLREPRLREEVFGPVSLVVSCASPAELEAVVRAVPGSLTATVHATAEDLRAFAPLVARLEALAGRLVFGGYPTGLEVCSSIQHGGPWPATTDARFTSVGEAAILRFARPVCWQNAPPEALPPELQDRNVRGIWRRVDGKMTHDDI